jgi:hypothetical protein
LQLDYLIGFTTTGEWIFRGNGDGIITPLQAGAKQFDSNGSSALKPIVIDKTALYVQGRGSNILSLNYDVIADGYRGNRISIVSEHLVKNHPLSDWAYQKLPNSIIWIVRDDGTLISITYLIEQQVIGFARHDTTGTFENVCVVREGSGATAEDAVYFEVKRTVHPEQPQRMQFTSK